MSETAKLQPSSRPSKWTSWLLIASLGVNLCVAGLAVGAYLHGGPGGRGDLVRDIGFGPYDGSLRPEDRAALKAALRAKSGDLMDARAAMIVDSQAVLMALRAEPFDPPALSAAMAAQLDHLGARMTLGTDTMRDYLAALPDKDRLAFAARLDQHLQRGRDMVPPPPN